MIPNNPTIPPFLYLVAQDLIDRFGTDLSRVKVVFPSRRARLFFNNYLYRYAQKPVWAPQYCTIEELFNHYSSLQVADNIRLIAELYEAYTQVYNEESASPTAESLDEFYFFGEILLSDFEDVDKNLVNATSLFSNLEDLDHLRDDFSHLTEEQRQLISRYFRKNFTGETILQDAFRSIWNILGKVYIRFRKQLKEKGIAYQGMQMREVIERNREEESRLIDSEEESTYAFVGFNVLSQAERELFKQLRKQSLFYWDFDRYYVNAPEGGEHEAGRFIKDNLLRFGSALDASDFDFFRQTDKKQITIIDSPSESGQASYLPQWINSLDQKEFQEPDTAIVLCNEQLLPTVIHAIPSQQVEHVNITMGFPITQTPICSFLQVLTEMQTIGTAQSGRSFRYKYVLPVLRHPYTQAIFPEAKEVEVKISGENIFFPTREILRHEFLFSPARNAKELAAYLLEACRLIGMTFKETEKEEDIYTGLYQESVFRAYQILNRLSGLIKSGELPVEKATFLRLMKKLLSTTQIPFHGEPVRGLQVMGVLETRTLDFKNLILLSTNEGYMPGTNNDNTFIPQFLRKHFGLSTVEHQDSVYAYYFYRLLQRAENITLVYNTDRTQLGKAEISRFLLQLLIDGGFSIHRLSLSASINPLQTETIEVPKSDQLLQKIRNQYDININPEAVRLSPSAINTFIDCSLKFYLQYIEDIKAKDELSDELDSSSFGTIFHCAAELLYRAITGIEKNQASSPFTVRKEHLDPYLSKDSLKLDKLIAKAFEQEFFKKEGVDIKQYNGKQLINFRVIRHMMRRLIAYDRRQTPFVVHALEYSVKKPFALSGKDITLLIGGIIDRLDEKDERLRILDYKTSGRAKTYKEIEDLFVQNDRRASHIFQTFLYASVLSKERDKKQAVVPALLYLQEAGGEDYSPVIPYQKEDISDFRELQEEFDDRLSEKLGELFDATLPFRQTEATKNCAYCDFKDLCNR